MKIKITYENTRQTLEMELDRKAEWLSLAIGDTDGIFYIFVNFILFDV